MTDHRLLGAEGKHLKLKLRDGPSVWDAVGFDLGSRANQLPRFVDIVYRLKSDRWGGRESLQLELLDFAPSARD